MVGYVIALGAVSMMVIGISGVLIGFVTTNLRAPRVQHLSDRELRTVGDRALAAVVAVRRTDGSSSSGSVACDLDFLVCPVDRSEAFRHVVRTVAPTDSIPRKGDAWPAWYLADDRRRVLVAAPGVRPMVVSQPFRPVIVPAAGVEASQHSAA